ncbi:hypothetical protein FN846DRAFT_982639 [Sphaerosporella brunnea]|uniref:Uncharacterized protein n=1 Tax=Sphaerosporella brunnea TaxID=1250544 RepID=A0A5J5EC45_9PEZI|nr:hypothetical protein FN846DRAFT_982639 [Sphaerosporella brunnea]
MCRACHLPILDFYLRILSASNATQAGQAGFIGKRALPFWVYDALDEDVLQVMGYCKHLALSRLKILLRAEGLAAELDERVRFGTLHEIETGDRTFHFRFTDDDEDEDEQTVVYFKSPGTSPQWQVALVPVRKWGVFSTGLPTPASMLPHLGWHPYKLSLHETQVQRENELPELAYNVQHQILPAVQTVLENAFFSFFQRELSAVVERKEWQFAEQAELNVYTREAILALSMNPALLCDGPESAGVLRDANEIRHVAVHRGRVSVAKLLELLDTARLVLLMLEPVGKRYEFVEELWTTVREETSAIVLDLQALEDILDDPDPSRLCDEDADSEFSGSQVTDSPCYKERRRSAELKMGMECLFERIVALRFAYDAGT